MKNWNFTLIVSLIICLSACQDPPTEQGLMGVWVGTYQGKREKAPFPAIYQFHADSTFHIIYPDTVVRGTWHLSGNLLQLADSNWHAYFRAGGKLNFKRSGKGTSNYRMLRRPEKTGQLISPQASQTTLSTTTWTNIREIPKYGFSRQDLHYYRNDSLYIHRRYFYQQDTLAFEEMESFCYQLEATADQQFALFFNGNNCDNALAPRQLIQLNDDQLVLLSFYHEEKQLTDNEDLHYFFFLTLNDSISRKLPDSASVFAPCRDEPGMLDSQGKIIYESRDSLNQQIRRTFKNFPNSQSGKITIYLKIDCQGKPGRINLIQTDIEGQPIYFAAPIVQQLFDLTVNYPFRANLESGLDSERKLTFEIDNGELVGVK